MTIFDATDFGSGVPVDTVASLNEAMGDWVLVGALARELVVNGMAGLPRGSQTHDVDIAIAVRDDEEYLGRTCGLAKDGGSRIRHRVGPVAVDVIAYGGIAPSAEFDLGPTTLDVTGMAETAACAVRVRLAAGVELRCAALHAQVVLKLVAWHVRRDATTKDAADLAALLAASSSGLFEDQVWDDETALAATGFVPDLAGPFRVGRQIRTDFGPAALGRLRDLLDSGNDLRRLVVDAETTPSGRTLLGERLGALRRGLDAGDRV